MKLTDPAPRWAVYPLLVLVAGVGFSAGHFLGPERVETRTQVVTVQHEVKVQAKALTRTVYVEKVTQPNGTITEKRSEQLAEKVDTTTKADSSSSATTERKVELRPDWRIGVLAGATWKEPALTIAGPLVLGVQVERRILGGVSVGAWGSTQGAAGASVSVEF